MNSLEGKKVVMVIAPADFRDEELEEPRRCLEESGATVTIASTTLNPVRGMLGAGAEPGVLLDQVMADDYDAVVFVGGSGARSYFASETAFFVAREFADAGKVVGAICVAPVILANAGLLKGRNVAVFSSERQVVAAAGANVVAASVVVDGNFVTATGPEAATQFGEALVSAIGGASGGGA